MIWLIGIGGSCGAAARYLLSRFINNKSSDISFFPFSTFIINISGSFILGLLANFYLTQQISDEVWFLMGIGFCGAFTTFSTFGHEAISLIIVKKVKVAFLYVLTSILLGVLSALIAFMLF